MISGTLQSLTIGLCIVFVTVSGFDMKLVSITACSKMPAIKSESISAKEFISLQAQTAQSPPNKVPTWLKSICKKVDCLHKVFKIDDCRKNYFLFCYFGNHCIRQNKDQEEIISWLETNENQQTNVENVQPWWFPNDRIM